MSNTKINITMDDKTKEILIKAGIGVGGAALGFLAAKALCSSKRSNGLSGIGYRPRRKKSSKSNGKKQIALRLQ